MSFNILNMVGPPPPTPPFASRIDRAKALARTYASLNNRDGWTRVEEFQRVQQWRSKYPDKGSSAASSALDLPRGRIRPWFNGSKPDPARAVEVADVNGWLDAQPGSQVFEALSVLHAWILAGGSILAKTYVPRLAVDTDDPRKLAAVALDVVGVDVTVSREREHDSEPSRSAELRPMDHASTLGRFLVAVLDAPLGEKAGHDIHVPAWLAATPFDTQLRWARTVVTLRGTQTDPRHGYRCQLKEESRPEDYYHDLGDCFATIVGDDDQVTVGAQTIRLRKRAAALLDVVPHLPD
jgi:hypothetical protein